MWLAPHLQAVDATSTTPSNHAYFHEQNNISSPFNMDELSSDKSPSSDTAPTKSRMRWTPELHERFVDAVNKLGGSGSMITIAFLLFFN
jgi:hypothetical protein